MITLIFEVRYNKYVELDEEDSAMLVQYAKDHEITILEAAIKLENMGKIGFDPTDDDNWGSDLVAYEES